MSSTTKQHKTTLWSVMKAHYEGSAYEGEYRGTMIRVERLMADDRDYDDGQVETRWDGYIANGMEHGCPRFVHVVECYRTRRDVVKELERYIDSQIAGVA